MNDLTPYNSKPAIDFISLPSSTKLLWLKKRADKARNRSTWTQEEIEWAEANAKVLAYVLAGNKLTEDYDWWMNERPNPL